MTGSADSVPPGAAARRHATPDPGRFLIPEQQLPPGFAERVEQPVTNPALTRPAATVVLAREGPQGPEALLLRRPSRSAFAAGAWVFPGGVVDAADADLRLADGAAGPGPGEWARRLGLDDPAEAWGYVVAALREAWEETGILLAQGAGAPMERLRGLRAALLDADLSLREALETEGLRLATEDLLYIAHWITPLPEPRRYDTRFFVARVPEGADCELYGEELSEARWMRPEDAVQGFEDGDLVLLPPTVHTLRRLAGFASLEALWAALRDAPVPVFLPRMRRDPRGVVIEI